MVYLTYENAYLPHFPFTFLNCQADMSYSTRFVCYFVVFLSLSFCCCCCFNGSVLLCFCLYFLFFYVWILLGYYVWALLRSYVWVQLGFYFEAESILYTAVEARIRFPTGGIKPGLSRFKCKYLNHIGRYSVVFDWFEHSGIGCYMYRMLLHTYSISAPTPWWHRSRAVHTHWSPW